MRLVFGLTFLVFSFVSAPSHAGSASTSPKGKVVPRLFMTSDRCMACHNGLTAPSGRDVSIGFNWQSSMMANASRDPYWQAAVRRETLEHPRAQAHIQDECAACHMPMARYQAHARGMEGAVFSLLPPLRQPAANALLAADGVSCTLCHQIQAGNLGTKESFTAGFRINTRKPPGQRSVFGPFVVDAGRTRIMQSSGRFVPTKGLHMRESGLCGSCHTLYTRSLGPDGEVIGELPEQVPYLEWLHSGYSEEKSCQSCHMPQLSAPTAISSVLGVPRDLFSRHAFRGGNFFMLTLLERYRGPLAVKASARTLRNASLETQVHLETKAARIRIDRIRRTKGRLAVEVAVQNLAGHKLPTAYPSRRAWIHFTVQDDNGQILFESGLPQDDGAITGNDNDRNPSLYEPHYEQIESSDQVQIYEAIMADPDDHVTTGLLSAVRFIKDNRVLPEGFHKETAHADIAVRGRAAKDKDFAGGGDHIRYILPLNEFTRPLKITAELWYQPIGYRWAHNLGAYRAAETDGFIACYNALAGVSALVLARDARSVPADLN
jgi:hypothetical protein